MVHDGPRLGASDLRATGLGFAGLMLGAIAIRAVAAARTHVVFNDGPIFLAMAEAIQEGRWADVLAHPFHPLYPLTIAGLAQMTGLSLEAAAIAVSIAGGALAVVGFALAARLAFGPNVGWMVGVIVALHPWAVDFSSDVMSDGLYSGFYALGFAGLVALIQRPTVARGMTCGVFSALAYLVRPEGVGLAICAFLLLFGRGLFEREARRRVLGSALALALATSLLMAPLLQSIASESGEWSLTRKKSVAALASGETGLRVDESRFSSQGVTIPLPRSSQRLNATGPVRPSRDADGAVEAVFRTVRTALASLRYEVALFVALGLWFIRREFVPSREATHWLPAIAYLAVLVLLVWGAGYVARRHALAPLLPLAAYAALGWQGVQRAGLERFAPLRRDAWGSPAAIVLGLVLTLSIVWGARDLRDRRFERIPVRAAAEWVGGEAGEGQRIAAQKLRVAYYARGHFVPLPSGEGGRIQTALRRAGAEWVVIDEARLNQHRGLREGVGDWLEIAHVESRDQHRVLVMRLR